MLRALSCLLLIVAVSGARGQVEAPAVTMAQVDAALEQASAALAEDDPAREPLLKRYADTKSGLLSYEKYAQSLDTFSQARLVAPGEAESLHSELVKLQAQPAPIDDTLTSAGLDEAEQMIQVDKAELAALKVRRADTRAAIDGMSTRTTVIRERLTELVGVLGTLDSQLALMNKSPEVGSEDESRLWLAQAESASGQAEKASLDAELLSQPMRLELLKAQLDKISFDVRNLEARLTILEQRTGELRQGEAEEALAEAELARAGAEGKHELVQKLADENAELTTSFSERGEAIEDIRSRDAEAKKSAEQLENDLKEIKHKLDILGMTTAIGEVLRAQMVDLPSDRDVHKRLSRITREIRDSSMRQIDLEDERRQLRNTRTFAERRLPSPTEDPTLLGRIGDDLEQLALARRDLVKKAVELESTYATALADLDITLRRYDSAVEKFRGFISERLLWIPSREMFAMFLSGGIADQLVEVFEPNQWREVLAALPAELVSQPLTAVSFILLLLLIYLTPRLLTRLQDTGRTVGYASNDLYFNTVRALGLSLLLAFKWPMLMLNTAWLLELEADSELASALSVALARNALYFWGLEFLRTILLPGCLAESHFRWPVPRVKKLHRRVRRLEQYFLPASFTVGFSIALYPREVGGALGAIGASVVLLSLAYFFFKLPQFTQGRIDLIFVDRQSGKAAIWGRMLRLALTWTPVLGIVAVLVGYSYTAIEFALLLVQTVVLYAALLLAQEMGLRWLRLARRRMSIKVREELAHATDEDGEVSPEEELLENDPDLLSDEGTKLLNAMILIGSLVGITVIWSEVFPALGILDSVELWQQSGVVDGREALVPVTLRDLFAALAIGFIGWIVARRIPGLLEILLRQRMHVSSGSAYAASRIFQYSLTMLIVVMVMNALGGSWSSIQWAVAALSVGIGFGLQEIVANFISGLIILFEQPIRVGDTVTVGQVSGVVTKIRMRATTIRDWDRRELLVPNKEFITSQLLNWSLSDPITRCSVEVGVAYGTDLYKAIELTREVARSHPRVLDDPAPFITFDSFGDNSLQITVRVYLDDLDIRLSTASALRLAINDRFNEEGIVVAFPQRDVHLDTSSPLDVRMISPQS